MTTNHQPITAELREMAQRLIDLEWEAISGPWQLVEVPLELSELGKEKDRKPSSYLTIETVNDHPQLKRPAPVIEGWVIPYFEPKWHPNIHRETGEFVVACRNSGATVATSLLAALDRVEELERYITELKENNFHWDNLEETNVCGFCGSHNNRVGGIKAHIRDVHGQKEVVN